ADPPGAVGALGLADDPAGLCSRRADRRRGHRRGARGFGRAGAEARGEARAQPPRRGTSSKRRLTALLGAYGSGVEGARVLADTTGVTPAAMKHFLILAIAAVVVLFTTSQALPWP